MEKIFRKCTCIRILQENIGCNVCHQILVLDARDVVSVSRLTQGLVSNNLANVLVSALSVSCTSHNQQQYCEKRNEYIMRYSMLSGNLIQR
jgi:hypothetical protein